MKSITFLFFALFLSACSPKDLPTVAEHSADNVLLKLSHQSTKAEMESFARLIEDYGLEMDYSESEFFETGTLRNLKLKVMTPVGGGSTTADQVTLQYKYYGFHYQKEGNPAFIIGKM